MPRWDLLEKRLCRRVAGNIRRLREGKPLTLEEAAHRADLHWRHWQKIEAGEVSPTLRTLTRLASALEVEPRELL